MKLSAYLIQDNDFSFTDLFKDDVSFTPYDKSEQFGFNVFIALGACKARDPEWLPLLRPAIYDIPDEYKNKSTRAVVIVKLDGYFIAYTLGQGRHLLEEDNIVRDFGIKIALNYLDPAKLKGMDKMSISENVIQQRFQSARSTTESEFQIDKGKDFLKTIAGETVTDLISNRLQGSEALHFNADVEFSDLQELSHNLLISYNLDTYKQHFSWFDNMQVEKNKSIIRQLESELLTRMIDGDKVYLVAPEIVDDLYIDKMSLTEHGELLDFDIDSVIGFLKEKNTELTVKQLKQRYVYIHTDLNEGGGKKWRLYNCLLTEITLPNGDLYSFMMGMWFKIKTDYRDLVQSFIESIPESAVILPEAKATENEAAYNSRVTIENSNFITMDMQYGKMREKVEFCDLLTRERQLIHVKPWKSSSTLSHLFSQGRVSGTMLINDSVFRKNVKDIINEINCSFDFIEDTVIDPSTYEIVYAIIYKENEPVAQRLPFFSKVNLMHNAQILQNMRYKVTVKHIVRKVV